jgi:hypothetical protein
MFVLSYSLGGKRTNWGWGLDSVWPKDKRSDADQHDFRGWIPKNGGGGGILPEHPKKFSVAMAKLKSFVVNEQIVEKPFCQCHWEI